MERFVTISQLLSYSFDNHSLQMGHWSFRPAALILMFTYTNMHEDAMPTINVSAHCNLRSYHITVATQTYRTHHWALIIDINNDLLNIIPLFPTCTVKTVKLPFWNLPWVDNVAEFSTKVKPSSLAFSYGILTHSLFSRWAPYLCPDVLVIISFLET
jgi:hypothetical protein